MNKKELSLKIAKKMISEANFDRELGVEIIDSDEGYMKLKMAVTDRMLNSHKTCQGGAIFAFADCAFAYACNSYNNASVAYSVDITFVNPAFSGDELVATAKEKILRGRAGIYDVEVRNQNGDFIALFVGKSRNIKGFILDDEELKKLEGLNNE